MGRRGTFVFVRTIRISHGNDKYTEVSVRYEFRQSGALYIGNLKHGKWSWDPSTQTMIHHRRKMSSYDHLNKDQVLFDNDPKAIKKLASEYKAWLMREMLR